MFIEWCDNATHQRLQRY